MGLRPGGGACAGRTGAIGGVGLRAGVEGWGGVGTGKGPAGLMQRPPQATELGSEVTETAVMRQGGTILGTTNKGDPFAFPMPDGAKIDRSSEVIEGFRALKLDALIGIGGDGSFAILRRLAPHSRGRPLRLPQPHN